MKGEAAARSSPALRKPNLRPNCSMKEPPDPSADPADVLGGASSGDEAGDLFRLANEGSCVGVVSIPNPLTTGPASFTKKI